MNNQKTTTRKIVIDWGGLMYDDEVAQESGCGWAIAPSDSVEYWEDGNRLDATEIFGGPLRCTSPCFAHPQHAVGHFLSGFPAKWRSAEIVLPNNVGGAA